MNPNTDPEGMHDSFVKTLSINLFGQLLLISTVSWAAEVRLPMSLHSAQEVLRVIGLILLFGSVSANLTTVCCAYMMRDTEGHEELAALSLRSVSLLILLQLGTYFLIPTPFKLAFAAAAAAMILRWSLAKGKFLLPSDFQQ